MEELMASNHLTHRTIILALLLTLWPASAFADVVASNNTIGTNATADATANQTNTTTIRQTNTSSIATNLDFDLTTGNNQANNTVGGDVHLKTGNGSATAELNNQANTNGGLLTTTSSSIGSATASNTNIGAGATATADTNQTQTTTLTRDNRSVIDTDLTGSVDTGGNTANGTIGGNVTLETGDAEIDIKITNQANTRPTMRPVPTPTQSGAPGEPPQTTPKPGPDGGGTTLNTVPAVTPSPQVGPSPSSPRAEAKAVTEVKPREGIGGAFAAGSDWLVPFMLLLFLSFAIAYAPEMSVFLARPVPQFRPVQV